MIAFIPPRLSTFEINCHRFMPMVAWYRELLDAKVTYRDSMQCWLQVHEGWHLILLDTQYGDRPREVAGIPGPSFEFCSLATLIGVYRLLKARNLYPERAHKNGLVTSLIYRDPDHNPVALRYVIPKSERASGTVNPLGDEFDPILTFEGF